MLDMCLVEEYVMGSVHDVGFILEGYERLFRSDDCKIWVNILYQMNWDSKHKGKKEDEKLSNKKVKCNIWEKLDNKLKVSNEMVQNEAKVVWRLLKAALIEAATEMCDTLGIAYKYREKAWLKW